MKLPLLILIFAATLTYGQSAKDSAKPDLSAFSSDQLKACFDNSKICGSNNASEIAGELASRLASFTTKQLLSCFADWKICGASDGQASGWPISDELGHRGNFHQYLERYWTEKDPAIRAGIIHVAYHFDTPEITAFMRRILTEHKEEAEELYWPANYLAKKCDPDGLKWLSSQKGRSQNCMQFATTVPLFGKCHYRQAIPYLVKYSLNDACLNVTDAAVHDLWEMYPHSPKEFNSIEEMQHYFCGRAKREGVKVDCDSK